MCLNELLEYVNEKSNLRILYNPVKKSGCSNQSEKLLIRKSSPQSFNKGHRLSAL